jgi:hypothetical protein
MLADIAGGRTELFEAARQADNDPLFLGKQREQNRINSTAPDSN